MSTCTEPCVWCGVDRSGEEDTGASATGEEDSRLPRGWPRHRRLVPGARRPTAQGRHGNQHVYKITVNVAVC